MCKCYGAELAHAWCCASLNSYQMPDGSCCLQVLVHPTAAHGGFLLDSKFRRQMLHAMQRTLAAGAALSAKQA